MTEGTITTLRLEQILTRERLLIMEHERVQTEVGRYHRNNRIMFPSKGDHPTKILGMTSDGWVVYLGMDDTPWAYVRPQDEAKKKFTNTDVSDTLRAELDRLITQYQTLESDPTAREYASGMSAHQNC
jgi:hypothetical protein